jgi:hypothetical protein
MKTKMKRLTTLLLAVVLTITTAKVSVFAAAQPRVAVQIKMSSSADTQNEVTQNQVITAVVSWKNVLTTTGEPVTLTATNGAQILIQNASDVTFVGDTSSSVSSISRNSTGDLVTLTTGTPSLDPTNWNSLIFDIKAPSNAGNFKLSAKVGSNSTPSNPQTNFVEHEFNMSKLLSVNTSKDTIDGIENFEVFGTIDFSALNYANAYMLAMEVRNKQSGAVAFNSTSMNIPSSGNYNMGTFAFEKTHIDGTYEIEIVLLDRNYNTLYSAKKDITHTNTIYFPIHYQYKCGGSSSGKLGFGGGILGSGRIGDTVIVTAPNVANAYVLNVTINGAPANFINGNQIAVLITGETELYFNYRYNN